MLFGDKVIAIPQIKFCYFLAFLKVGLAIFMSLFGIARLFFEIFIWQP